MQTHHILSFFLYVSLAQDFACDADDGQDTRMTRQSKKRSSKFENYLTYDSFQSCSVKYLEYTSNFI